MISRTTRHCYRVDRSQIRFIKFILEAYDNMAVMSTIDARQAIVQVTIAPGCETLVKGIMNGFSEGFEVVPVDVEATTGTRYVNCSHSAIEKE